MQTSGIRPSRRESGTLVCGKLCKRSPACSSADARFPACEGGNQVRGDKPAFMEPACTPAGSRCPRVAASAALTRRHTVGGAAREPDNQGERRLRPSWVLVDLRITSV